MATYPNNYRTGVGFNPNYTYFGNMPLFSYNAELGTGAGSRLNWQIGDQGGGFKRTASCPDGYGMQTPFPPVKAGSVSAWNNNLATLTMTGNMLQGGPMEGTATVAELTATSGLSLVVGLAGNAAVATLTGNSMVLRLTVGLNGNGSFQLTGTNNLAMIVPFEGAGSVMTMGAGATDLRGRLSMAGEWTPFTELSPENLAREVWNALSAQYDAAGTMGALLNTSGSGGLSPAQSASLVIIEKLLRNKMITDPATGVLTVYDNDGATPLLTANIFKDAAGTTPYNGTGAERRERLA